MWHFVWENFLKSFIPLFVAFDIVGVLPFFAKFSLNMDEKKRGARAAGVDRHCVSCCRGVHAGGQDNHGVP